MKSKSVIIVIMLFAACVVGMGAVSIFHQPYVFYVGEGEIIPYQAVDSLVKAQFVHISPAGVDTINKYFGDEPPIYNVPEKVDLLKEYRLIKPTDTLKGYWQDGVLHIRFNNSSNR